MTKNEFDAYSDNYTDTVEQSISFSGLSHGFFQLSKALMIKDLLAMRMRDQAQPTLLDVGCGVGALHPLLAPMFGAINGVDVSKDSILMAQDNNPTNLYQDYDGQSLPYANDSFDMSLAVCVMHHVPTEHWVNFLAEMTRVVVPGGMVCLIEHNPINPATRLSVARCPFDADAVLLGAGQMKRRLREAGLADVSTRHFVFLPSNRPLFRSFERRLHWLPLGAQYAAIGRVT